MCLFKCTLNRHHRTKHTISWFPQVSFLQVYLHGAQRVNNLVWMSSKAMCLWVSDSSTSSTSSTSSSPPPRLCVWLSLSLRDRPRVRLCQWRSPPQQITLSSFLPLLLIAPRPGTVQTPCGAWLKSVSVSVCLRNVRYSHVFKCNLPVYDAVSITVYIHCPWETYVDVLVHS